MATIEKQVSDQEKVKRENLYQDNSTDAERTIYWKLKKILEHYRDNVFPDMFDIIKAKKLYNKEYEHELKKHHMENKSAKIYPLILSVHDTFMASLYDNDLRPKIFPVEDIDADIVDNAERFFQWWVEISETEETQETIRNEASLIGTSYWIPGYTTTQIKDDEWETKTIFIPALFPVSFFEMFHSVGATDFYKAPEKFRRRFMSFDQLKDAFFPIWDEMWVQVEKKKTAILEAPMPLSKADFTKIYDIFAYSNTYINYMWDKEVTWLTYDETFNVLDSSSYCEVVDLYIWDQLMVMVNGYFVYSWVSPFYYWEDMASGKEWPFIELTYEKWKWAIAQWIWQKLMWHQRQCNALYNSISDAMYRHLNPILATIQWALIDPTTGNAPTVIDYREWKVYNINPSYAWVGNAISKLDFTDYNILSLSINYFEWIKADAFNIAWVNSYVMGWEGKVERSRYWAEQKVNSSKARLNPMIKSIWRFYSKLFYHWLWLSKQSWATTAYIQDEDGTKYIINLDELDKKFKIVCSADTNVEESKWAKVQGLLTMQQNTAQFAQNPITWLSDIDNWAFLSSIADYAGLKWFKPMSVEEQKEYIDKSYEIKNYIAQKEAEAQQQTQQQPTEQQPMSQDEMAMLQQMAGWQQPQQAPQQPPEEELDYTFA